MDSLKLLTTDFAKDLESEGEDAQVKMLVKHIHKMPKGKDEGEFLVVDMEVNHLRVWHISELIFTDNDIKIHYYMLNYGWTLS